MNANISDKRSQLARSQIWLLIGMGIILFLVLLLILPNISRQPRPRIASARNEILGLVAALQQYEACYNRWPFMADTNGDVTLGINREFIRHIPRVAGTRWAPNHADILIILTDLDTGVNAGHQRNPQQHRFADFKMVNDITSSGLSTIDHQLRDPWGHPYLISLDMNWDDRVRDAFYVAESVSKTSSLVNTNGGYELNRGVMVWSLGPDGQADGNLPADVGVNRDNILSWP